jgi:hypothetical protein
VSLKILLRAALAAASLLGAVGVSATAASAAWDGCAATGYACVYKNSSGSSGGVKAYSGTDPDYSDNNFSSCTLNCNVNDETSSIWNRETFTTRFYVDSGFLSSAMDVGAGATASSIGFFNDQLSSHNS